MKPLPGATTAQPAIIIFPDLSHPGHFHAQSVMSAKDTAMALSNLALSFAIQAGQELAYKEAKATIVNPNTGKLAIQEGN